MKSLLLLMVFLCTIPFVMTQNPIIKIDISTKINYGLPQGMPQGDGECWYRVNGITHVRYPRIYNRHLSSTDTLTCVQGQPQWCSSVGGNSGQFCLRASGNPAFNHYRSVFGVFTNYWCRFFESVTITRSSLHSASQSGAYLPPPTSTSDTAQLNCIDRGCLSNKTDSWPPSTGEDDDGVCDDTLCPLIIDVGRDGFDLGGPESAIFYDLYGNGIPVHMQWTRRNSDEAFLVADLNQNGIVDDGQELFGSGSRLIMEGDRLAPNGFVALAQYDHVYLGGNDDGYISNQDDIWAQLYLWQDLNGDGVSRARELIPIYQITGRIETIPRELQYRDQYNNWLRYLALCSVFHDESTINFLMVDVFFDSP